MLRTSRDRLYLLVCSLFALLVAYLLFLLSGVLPIGAMVEERASQPAPGFYSYYRRSRAIDDVPGRMSLPPSGERTDTP
jgi:hypothetical protein